MSLCVTARPSVCWCIFLTVILFLNAVFLWRSTDDARLSVPPCCRKRCRGVSTAAQRWLRRVLLALC